MSAIFQKLSPDFPLCKLFNLQKVSSSETFENINSRNKSSYPCDSFDLNIIELSQIEHSITQMFL